MEPIGNSNERIFLCLPGTLSVTTDGIFNIEIENAHPLFSTDLFGIHRCTIGNILGNARTKSKSRDRLWRAEGIMADVIVILGAIFSYNVMQATKALDILRDILASISEDKRIQVLLISWCFGGFLESRGGLWYSGRHSDRYSYRIGFNPLKAAIASLVANTVPLHSARSGSRFLFWRNRLTCRFIP